MSKAKKPKTYFEQVPLEVVKRIAEQDVPDDETNGNDKIDKIPKKP